MKKIVFNSGMAVVFYSLMAIMISLSAQAQQAAVETAAFSWEAGTIHDFGEITQNEPVSNEFEFTNTGSAPLVISNVKGSCGCTVTSYSEESVLPGEKGRVTATYNAKKAGVFNKTIKVKANTESPVILQVKGVVMANPQ